MILQNEKLENSCVSLRGHTSDWLNNKLIIFGGVSGFYKFSDKIYEINLDVSYFFKNFLDKSDKKY